MHYFFLAEAFLLLFLCVSDWSNAKFYRSTSRRCGAGQIPVWNSAAGFAVFRNNRPWAKHLEHWKYYDFSEIPSCSLMSVSLRILSLLLIFSVLGVKKLDAESTIWLKLPAKVAVNFG